jgi:hypothetical protein
MYMHLRKLAIGNHGDFEPTLVQRVVSDHGVVWAFADGKSVCLAEGGDGAVACSRLADVISKGLSMGAFAPPTSYHPWPHDFVLCGLAPDRIHHVVITVGKQERVISVQENMYSASADRPILVSQFTQ